MRGTDMPEMILANPNAKPLTLKFIPISTIPRYAF
jgi:hypothetical protein